MPGFFPSQKPREKECGERASRPSCIGRGQTGEAVPSSSLSRRARVAKEASREYIQSATDSAYHFQR
jgi:hypothetical protein